MITQKASTVDEYISNFPPETQALLEELRACIKMAAPKAQEIISYAMPAYKQDGMLVYFAAYAKHIGFYPTGSGIAKFEKEIAKYAHSKGAVQFPLAKPIPLALVTKMVKFKLKENAEKAAAKKKK
ncbi:MAG: hypothetical protein CFE21_13930 [Bacteroidetes bacterium B1(2017)]|nr:MAG: hypothetical protein CFE21_13930 [Bacteroidetes bacterium B1(2017)]